VTPDPRLSVSGVSTWNWSFDEDLAFCATHGVAALGVSWRKLRAAPGDPIERLMSSGVDASNIIETAGAPIDEVLDVATIIDAAVVITSGAPNGRSWEDAADGFAAFIAGLPDEHRRRVLLEHTNPFRVDLSFVHTLRDALDLARRVDVGVCMEVNACWIERGLAESIAAGVSERLIRLVQVSDFVVGTKATPDRAVPGDGDIPLARIVDQLLAAGYTGRFDLEIIGPRIEAEGYERAVSRSLARVSELLQAAGSPTH
jgi:sugar phosphate isomerase/epimerase